MRFAVCIGGLHVVGDGLERHLVLGHDGQLGARRNGREQGQVAGVAAHDLDDERAMMRRCSVFEPVDIVSGRVEGGIEANGDLGIGQIVVDGGGDAHHRKA